MTDEFKSKEWLEHFQKMWNPLNFPLPGMVQPTLDPDEIAKKIAELKAVESWLKMNVSMVEMTINGMEMQKSALETLRDAAKQGDGSKKKKDTGRT